MIRRLKWVAGLLLFSGVLFYLGGVFWQQNPRETLVSTVKEIRGKGWCQPEGNKLCGYDELRIAFGSPMQRFCYRYLNNALLLMEASCLHQVTLELREADLSLLDIAQVNISNADLSGGDLRQANLSGSSLRMTDLSRANLSGAILESTKTLYKVDHASFRKARLRGATSMFQASFKQVDFTEADLREVNFGRSDFLDANFTKADLRYANLAYSRLSGALFSDARVENLVLHQASGLDNQTLDWLKKNGAIVDQEGLEKSLQDGLRIPVMWWFNLSNMDLSRVDFSDVTLSGVTFTGTQLNGAKFVNASLDQANFHNADLRGADFSGSYLIHADFSGADLRGARFDNAVRLETIKFDSATQFPDNFPHNVTPDSP
ncbi:hypothetical protein GCM10023116_33980 [Kistimonas scapharcae]|uniref:Pentapeptide repeat-containing protein n=1 Tax=Kistimonas scapharcae TaxID=1036133 RepID=A0ABP8V7A2_9GAMM